MIVAFLLILKSLFGILNLQLISKWAIRVHQDWTRRLLHRVFHDEWGNFNQTNYGLKQQMINDALPVLIDGVMLPVSLAILELAGIFAILFAMFGIDKILSIIVILIVSLCLFLVMKLVVEQANIRGASISVLTQNIYEEFNFAFAMNKEASVYKLQSSVWKELYDVIVVRASNRISASKLVTVPRYLLETIMITALAIAFSIQIFSRNEALQVTLLATFALAALRLVPYFYRATAQIGALKLGLAQSLPLLDHLASSLDDVKVEKNFLVQKPNEFSRPIGLKIADLTFDYGTKVNIFEKANFHIEPGTVNLIIGSNGSGKTTILEIIAGLLPVKSNSLFFYDSDESTPLSTVSSRISYMGKPQVGMTIPLKRYLNPFNIDIQNSVIHNYFNMFDLPNYNLDDAINSINPSAGQLQRILFIRSILRCPNLLLVDEGMNFLDSDSRQKILQYVLGNKNNMTTIFVSHEDSLNLIADNIFECRDNTVRRVKVQ